MKTLCSTLALAVVLAAIGCEERETAKPSRPAAPAAPTAATGLPAAPRPTIPPTPTGAAPAAGARTVSALGLGFTVPDGWKQVPPANPMRLVELQVPDSSGDPGKACTVAFSSAGGDVQSNIDRWAGQVLDAGGKPSKPAVQTRTVAGMPVTVAEMSGSYSGMSEAAHTNWTLRGAIIETPAGLLFIKMTGPAEPMAAAGGAFNTLVDSLKKP